MNGLDGLRVALVHDWLTGMRGGEKVLAELCRLFPAATVYTLVHQEGSVSEPISGRKIVTSSLQRLPFGATHYRYYLPYFPSAARSLRIDAPVDLVISSSHAAAKAVDVPPGARHLCYCHSPMRYIWDGADYFEFGPTRHLRRLGLAPWRARLRRWDREAARRVDLFVANSEYVRDRIGALYGCDSVVVHPPVDTEFFTAADSPRSDAALVVSALVPYKRIDLAVRAFTRLGRRLRIVGAGTERRALQRIAGPTIEFLGTVTDEQLRALYRSSRCLVFPGREDFGIVPVEAQACGTPVAAYAAGGALETVVDGTTGVLFSDQTVEGVESAIGRLASMSLDARQVRRQAERFGPARFRDEFCSAVNRVLGKE